jgi:hypothetical protein
MESWKMRADYLIRVRDLMLPRPTPKDYLEDNDEILPIVRYTVQGWDDI